MFAKDSQQAFVGTIEDVVGDPVIQERIKSLRISAVAKSHLVEAAPPVRSVWRSTVPDLAVLEI